MSFLGCVCTDCCDYVAISGRAGIPSTSIFAKTNITTSNRPVYQNSDGQYLFYIPYTEESEWTVGSDYIATGVGLGGIGSADCPSDVLLWVEWVPDLIGGVCTAQDTSGCIRVQSGATVGCTAPTTGAPTTALPGCLARLHDSCNLRSFVSVNCGGHMASNCTACPTTACPAGNCGSGWCQGECSWDFSIDTCGHPSASFTLHPPYCLFDAASSTLRFNAGNYTGMPKFV